VKADGLAISCELVEQAPSHCHGTSTSCATAWRAVRRRDGRRPASNPDARCRPTGRACSDGGLTVLDHGPRLHHRGSSASPETSNSTRTMIRKCRLARSAVELQSEPVPMSTAGSLLQDSRGGLSRYHVVTAQQNERHHNHGHRHQSLAARKAGHTISIQPQAEWSWLGGRAHT